MFSSGDDPASRSLSAPKSSAMIQADLLLIHAPAVFDFRDRPDIYFPYLCTSGDPHVRLAAKQAITTIPVVNAITQEILEVVAGADAQTG